MFSYVAYDLKINNFAGPLFYGQHRNLIQIRVIRIKNEFELKLSK